MYFDAAARQRSSVNSNVSGLYAAVDGTYLHVFSGWISYPVVDDELRVLSRGNHYCGQVMK